MGANYSRKRLRSIFKRTDVISAAAEFSVGFRMGFSPMACSTGMSVCARPAPLWALSSGDLRITLSSLARGRTRSSSNISIAAALEVLIRSCSACSQHRIFASKICPHAMDSPKVPWKIFQGKNHKSSTRVTDAERQRWHSNWKQDRSYGLPHCNGGWAEGVSQEREKEHWFCSC